MLLYLVELIELFPVHQYIVNTIHILVLSGILSSSRKHDMVHVLYLLDDLLSDKNE